MLLPATFGLEPVSALIMMAGIFYGAQYGGSTTAILINLPGEATSVVTALDGYQMARKGAAGRALAAAALSSFFAGTVCTVLIALFAPPLTDLAFKFGPAEYFSLMVLGLAASVVLASGSIIHALAMIVLGLLLGLVGTDVNSGAQRYAFGLPELADGFNFVIVAMGMFGIGEIIANLEDRSCAAPLSARCSASCRGAVRHSPPSGPMRWKSVSRNTRMSSARALSRASLPPRLRTMPARRCPSSPCSRSAFRPIR